MKDPRIPLYLITGFLDSGKTSFINGILGSFVRAEFADSAPKPEKKEEEAAGPEEPEE